MAQSWRGQCQDMLSEMPKKQGAHAYGFASLNKDMFCLCQFSQIHHSSMYAGKHFADLYNSMKSHLSFLKRKKKNRSTLN